MMSNQFRFDFFSDEDKPEEAGGTKNQEKVDANGVGRVYPPISSEVIQYRKILVDKETFEVAECDVRTVEAGVYEGGGELWECAIDLVRYLENTKAVIGGMRVLELGCGRALPSLWALRRGARAVALCDYNADVLTRITAPSIQHEKASATSSYYYGPWGPTLSSLLEADHGPFDLILSAETTYRTELAQQLAHTVARHLKNDGEAYIATKRYYFGTGGGADAFMKALAETQQTDSLSFCASIVWTCQDGASNIRDIIRVTRRERL